MNYKIAFWVGVGVIISIVLGAVVLNRAVKGGWNPFR